MTVPLVVLRLTVADVVTSAQDPAMTDHGVHVVLHVQRVIARGQVVVVEVLEVVIHDWIFD